MTDKEIFPEHETESEVNMKEIVISKSGFISPAADLQTAVETYQMMADFVRSVLREEVDYGTVPGTTKPTLLKPGAEKLLRFFGLYSRLELQEKIEDWAGEDHDGEPFFFYRYKAQAIRGGEVVAEAIGSCNSWEKKYRYRIAELLCPDCKQPLRKSKQNDGYYCWTKTGGCGANWSTNDPALTSQTRGYVKNPDVADLVNTVDKISQKRALVAVALVACNASEYFTQDIEDMEFIDGKFAAIAEQARKGAALAEAAERLKADYPLQDEPSGVRVAGTNQIIKVRDKVITDQASPETLKPDDEFYEELAKEQAPVVMEKAYDFTKRPYDPATLREALKIKAPSKKPATDAQLRLLAAVFAEYFQDKAQATEAKRYLFGVPSLKEVDSQTISATLSWLKLSKDSGGAYIIDETARKELSAVVDTLSIEEGQQTFLG